MIVGTFSVLIHKRKQSDGETSLKYLTRINDDKVNHSTVVVNLSEDLKPMT